MPTSCSMKRGVNSGAVCLKIHSSGWTEKYHRLSRFAGTGNMAHRSPQIGNDFAGDPRAQYLTDIFLYQFGESVRSGIPFAKNFEPSDFPFRS
jgi:hypothetical protein